MICDPKLILDLILEGSICAPSPSTSWRYIDVIPVKKGRAGETRGPWRYEMSLILIGSPEFVMATSTVTQ